MSNKALHRTRLRRVGELIVRPLHAVSRKLKWPSIVITALVLAAMVLLAAGRPQNKPLTIAFVGFTNASYADKPMAVFVVTNTHSRTLTYGKHIERKTSSGWPVYVGRLPHNDSGYHVVPAGRQFRLIEYPPSGDAPWRLSVVYSLEQDRWENFRWSVREFFYDRNFPAIADWFHGGVECIVAVSSEMHK